MKDVMELFEIGMDRKVPALVPFATRLPEMGVPLVLNLGCGKKVIEFTVPLDLPEWNADAEPIPFNSGSVDGVIALHFLEHCTRPIEMLREIQRVLRPGGVANIVVPYYSAMIAAQDLDHKHSFCEETWKTLFKNKYYTKNGTAEDWRFTIGSNVIMGIVERNLSLVTQLIRQ